MRLGFIIGTVFAFVQSGESTFGLIEDLFGGGGLIGGNTKISSGGMNGGSGWGEQSVSISNGGWKVSSGSSTSVNQDKSSSKVKIAGNQKRSFESSNNFLQNGNFKQAGLISGYKFIKKLPGWEINEVQIGVGNIYNRKWGKTIVIELDGNQNDFIRQRVNLNPGFYDLKFDFAARTGFAQSSACGVYWNGQKVQTITTQDEGLHQASIQVEGKSGQNVLQIRSEGKQDTYGLAIANIRLLSSEQDTGKFQFTASNKQWRVIKNQLFINSDFQIPSRSQGHGFLKQMRGWNFRQIEQGVGRIYNRRWGNKVVIQLDANQNQSVTQSVSLKKGIYRFELNYAARQGHAQSSKLYITLNDKLVTNVSVDDQQIHKLFFSFEVSQPGEFEFGIHGDADSDSFGMTVGQVSLSAVQGRLSTNSITKQICYETN